MHEDRFEVADPIPRSVCMAVLCIDFVQCVDRGRQGPYGQGRAPGQRWRFYAGERDRSNVVEGLGWQVEEIRKPLG